MTGVIEPFPNLFYLRQICFIYSQPILFFSFNDIFDFERAEPSLHENDKDKQIVSIVWTGDIRIDFKRRDTLAKRQTK